MNPKIILTFLFPTSLIRTNADLLADFYFDNILGLYSVLTIAI